MKTINAMLEAKADAKAQAKQRHDESYRKDKLNRQLERDAAADVAEAIARRDGHHITMLTTAQIHDLRGRGLSVEVEQHREGKPPTWRVSDAQAVSRWEQADLDAARKGSAAWVNQSTGQPRGLNNIMASQLDAVFKK